MCVFHSFVVPKEGSVVNFEIYQSYTIHRQRISPRVIVNSGVSCRVSDSATDCVY